MYFFLGVLTTPHVFTVLLSPIVAWLPLSPRFYPIPVEITLVGVENEQGESWVSKELQKTRG
jgi:hypothetical protein